ncbi:MAG TPA: ATP-binding protein [Aggregatilineales bacterium]|nr:ATP-binding protein [Aggregatilineales bacterium]
MLLLPDFRVRQRDFLLEISRALTSQLNLDEVLKLILQAAASMLGGSVGLIALRQDDEDSFHALASIGVDPELIPLFDPLLEYLARNTDDDFKTDELNVKIRRLARRLDIHMRQAIALPMVMRGSTVGVILVFRAYAGTSSPNDRLLLQSFADQAAIAVHNAQLYQSVNQEQQRLAAILDHSADGVMILDEGQRILRFNKALGRMLGWPPAEAIGQSHGVVIHWEHVDQGQSLEDALAAGWPRPWRDDEPPDSLYVEGDVLRPDGSRISLGITYAPLLDEQGALNNVIASVRDITHFRQAEEMKSTFISVVSHELKTPVALIKGYAGTLRRKDARWDSETIQRSLEVIEDEADRLGELIENLLAASKLQADGMRLTNIGDVNLATIAAHSVERFQTQTPIHKLVLDFPPDFPSVPGDEMRLRQVIDNLLGNAIKYSPKGGEVRISGAFDDRSVTLSVTDHGVGLAPDEQERIFERFYRVDGALSRKTQGTGLGLYLARAVIEAHGGQISVESQPGVGSTFSFTLPRE